MARVLDLADIQGNILQPYGLPKARYIFLNIEDSPKGRDAGRTFVQAIRPRITSSLPWKSRKSYPQGPSGRELPPKPQVTFNIAFTFAGLVALGLPTRTLMSMPAEFIDGMAARASILGDDFLCGPDSLDAWDPIWRDTQPTRVHVMLSLNAQMKPDGTAVEDLDHETAWVVQECAKSQGRVKILTGHQPDLNLPYQDTSVLFERDSNGALQATRKEHFRLSDGFSDPAFDGQYPPETEKAAVIGGGKILPDQSWAPLATGEFLLGYPDEAQEVPVVSTPIEFTRNGTFLVYRKLHQNVGSFDRYLRDQAAAYMQVAGIPDIGQAHETLQAKLVGRWSDGTPLMAAPTYNEWKAFQQRAVEAQASKDAAKIAAIEAAFIDFKYRTDPDGAKCPLTAHIRRANTRDALDPTGDSKDSQRWNGSVINNRRRILRRGLPYGQSDLLSPSDKGDHGIIFLAFCASLFRQFEFVQQQWIQYGLDFNAGNDTCPVVGNHGPEAKFVIPGDTQVGTRPFLCAGLPQFVEVRGGDYFFVPSLTGLRMIGMGTVDPT